MLIEQQQQQARDEVSRQAGGAVAPALISPCLLILEESSDG
jgi:hypothetical protein